MLTALLAACLVSLVTAARNDPHRTGASALISIGDVESSPPIIRPASQEDILKGRTKSPHEHWQEETSPRRMLGVTNCLLCEEADKGACRSQPSCVYCERTVTALCEKALPPCLRCTVIKNPFFRCSPGEKYMDECDSCRCVDGHSGWCTNQFCEFRPLYLYAMALSEGELYY